MTRITMVSRRELLHRFIFGGCVTLGGASASGCTTTPIGTVTTTTTTTENLQQPLPSVTVDEMGNLVGAESVNHTLAVDVGGCDLGSMFEYGGRIHFLFGDTFGAGGDNWRSNTMAYTTDFEASDRILFDGWITDEHGRAKELVSSQKDENGAGEITCIPTHGIAVDGTIYVFYMSVHEWLEGGYWTANHSGIAISTDGGSTFEKHEPMWSGDSNFVQVALARDIFEEGPGSNGVFVWGIQSGRQGGVRLAWVPPDSFTVPSAYQYYTGSNGEEPLWGDEAQAVDVVPPSHGEHSVAWNDYLQRWMLTGFEGATCGVRFAPRPWGQWSEPVVLTGQWRYPASYGAYVHPRYFEEDGRVFYFMLSQLSRELGIYGVKVLRAEFNG